MGALIEKPNCVSDVDLGGEVSNLSLEYIPPRFGVVARLRNPEAPCDCIFQGVFETRRGKHGSPPVALVVECSNVVTTLPDEFLKFFKRLLAYAHGYRPSGCPWVPVCFRGNTSGLTKRKIAKKIIQIKWLWQSYGGEGGIRTPGPSPVNGFQDRRFQPLSHLSPGAEHSRTARRIEGRRRRLKIQGTVSMSPSSPADYNAATGPFPSPR